MRVLIASALRAPHQAAQTRKRRSHAYKTAINFTPRFTFVLSMTRASSWNVGKFYWTVIKLSTKNLRWNRPKDKIVLSLLMLFQCFHTRMHAQYSTACNLGTVSWKNFALVSYCRVTQELLNGTWIMEIHPGDLNVFSARHFFWALVNSLHKTIYCGVHGHLGFNHWTIKELLYLLVFVWSIESEKWPR